MKNNQMRARTHTHTHSGGAHSFFLSGISYSSLHPNKPVGAAIMGRKPCIYSPARINGRTTSCVAREAVIFNMLWCQHVAGAFPWFPLRDRAGTSLSVRHRDRRGGKRETRRLIDRQSAWKAQEKIKIVYFEFRLKGGKQIAFQHNGQAVWDIVWFSVCMICPWIDFVYKLLITLRRILCNAILATLFLCFLTQAESSFHPSHPLLLLPSLCLLRLSEMLSAVW